jgi:tRNA pseudouridine55 synthase
MTQPTTRPPETTCDGLLLVDKPSGPTSHDIVDKVRRTFRIKKVGHGGTLDPMATGLLVLLVGRGTKLSQRVMDSDKIYTGTMKLGVTTDSQDADGEIQEERDYASVTEEALATEMQKLVGDLMQTPPMHSAIKVNGTPLYKLAHKGKSVERKPRLIHIYRYKLLGFDPPNAQFEVKCTKGTYVRTLCADIGEQLGCGAHLAQLRRVRSGQLDIKDAIPLNELLNLKRTELKDRVIPIPDVIIDGQS